MAEKNNPKDQDSRSWGEKARAWFNETTTGRPDKMVKVKDAEESVKKLRKYKRP